MVCIPEQSGYGRPQSLLTPLEDSLLGRRNAMHRRSLPLQVLLQRLLEVCGSTSKVVDVAIRGRRTDLTGQRQQRLMIQNGFLGH